MGVGRKGSNPELPRNNGLIPNSRFKKYLNSPIPEKLKWWIPDPAKGNPEFPSLKYPNPNVPKKVLSPLTYP